MLVCGNKDGQDSKNRVKKVTVKDKTPIENGTPQPSKNNRKVSPPLPNPFCFYVLQFLLQKFNSIVYVNVSTVFYFCFCLCIECFLVSQTVTLMYTTSRSLFIAHAQGGMKNFKIDISTIVCLECAPPKCWSKYTTHQLSGRSLIFLCSLF